MSQKKKIQKSNSNNIKIGDSVILWDSINEAPVGSTASGHVINISEMPKKTICLVKWKDISSPLAYESTSLAIVFDPNSLFKEIV